MHGSLREAFGVLREAYDKWDLLEMSFPNDLTTRRVDDERALPHYPYRDDGKEMWGAVHKWMDAFVRAVYPAPLDETIAGDVELQAWAAECADQSTGGRVKGMPERINDAKTLVDVLTSIVFLAGPGHAAINYSQYDYMSYVPNMPLGVYADIELLADQREPITHQQLLTLLPNFDQSAAQLEIVFSLSAYKFDRLGQYDRTFEDFYCEKFADVFQDNAAALLAYEAFQADLRAVEATIDKRNESRFLKYLHMKPSNVTNSMSI
jgi:arachidonate 15-lipoxygenase